MDLAALVEKDIFYNTEDTHYILQGVIDEDDTEGASYGDQHTRDIDKECQGAPGNDPHKDHAEGHQHTYNRCKIHTNPLLRAIWNTAT